MSDASRALTVTEVMTLTKRTLESVTLRVMGEVSEFTDKSGYKAVYFTLCDGSSVMPCLVWRDAYAASGVELRHGMLVEVSGTLTVYPPKGRLQFQVRSLQAAGEGALRLKVAALARTLEDEGLMRPERKRALPPFPERIALVTSPRGKAVHDVIRTLRRRYPAAELIIAGVAVEGADAVAAIVSGIQAAGASGADVVILARGGGSYEDLMPFNEEAVARAVAACPVPVVTGIGHEPDTSIADMVADLRASTPTAAAEAVAPSGDEVAARFRSLQRLLGRGLLHAVRDAGRRVEVLASHAVFRDPRFLTSVASQRLDTAAAALPRAIPERLRRDGERLASAERALFAAVGRRLERAGDEMARAAARIADLSPLGILSRGYAVCYADDGRRVVRSSADLSAGDRVRVRLHQGALGCVVESVESEGAMDV
ncbi:MAG: exodeoxyribonuclease VII large subunit [Coriobacteriia bacterium]|nr:exodeoxyribonuclease VII large subunit [Coriobacteriia bacterium]